MNRKLDLEVIKKEGQFIDGGRERDVYRYNNHVYKIAERYPQQNAREYYNYISKKNIMYNPILDINYNSTILEVEECINLPELIIAENNLKNTENNYRYIKYEVVESENIFEIVSKYNLSKYMKNNFDEVMKLCKDNKHDELEVLFPLNWGYNKKLDRLVIIDYAD